MRRYVREEVAYTPPIQVVSKWYIRLYRRHADQLASIRARAGGAPRRRRRQMPPGVVKFARSLPQIEGNWWQFVSISRRGWLHSRGLCTQRVGINLIPDASDRLINFHGRRTCPERIKGCICRGMPRAQHFPRESIYPRRVIQIREEHTSRGGKEN